MMQQIIRIVLSLFNGYSFVKNPTQYIVTTIIVTLIPILTYVIGGMIAFVFLIALVGFLIYKIVKANKESSSSS